MARPPERGRPRPLLLALMVLPALAVLIGLGVWQLDRREWKHDLIARLEARLAEPPIPLPRAGADLGGAEFRRLRIEGRLLHERSQFLVGRSWEGRTGYGLFTPVALRDGRHIFLDRGWIPLAAKEEVLRRKSAAGPTAVEGVLRLPSGGGSNAALGNEHYRIDVSGMAAAAGLDPATVPPAWLVAVGPAERGSYPVPGRAAVELTDNHLQYALTWFGLAAALVAVAVVAGRRR